MSLNSSGASQLGAVAAGTTAAGALAVQPGVAYVQVATCATASITAATAAGLVLPGVSLPASVAAGQLLTIRNDGLGVLAIWPNAAGTAAINGLSAGLPWFCAANGGIVTLVSGGSLQWYVVYQAGRPVIPVATAATAIDIHAAGTFANFNGCILQVPAMGGACTLSLPTPTIANAAAGFQLDVLASGTIGNAFSCTSTGVNIQVNSLVMVYGNTAMLCTNTAAAGQTTVALTATAIKGDRISLLSNGVEYVADCWTGAAAGISVA